ADGERRRVSLPRAAIDRVAGGGHAGGAIRVGGGERRLHGTGVTGVLAQRSVERVRGTVRSRLFSLMCAWGEGCTPLFVRVRSERMVDSEPIVLALLPSRCQRTRSVAFLVAPP